MTDKSRAEQLVEKRKFWKERIQNWQESGLTQTEYCRIHNLTPHQFTYWKQRIVKPPETPVSLVQVNMKSTFNPNSLHHSPLRMTVGDQYRIEIDRGFDPVALQQLLFTLKQL